MSKQGTGSVSSRLKKIAVAVIGFLVLFVGIIAIPYPGPGWLIVFAGLGILSTEFEWAQRVLDSIKARYDAWQAWIRRQNPLVRTMLWAATAMIVVVTIWLLNGYGLLNDWLNLGMDWVRSPLFAR